MPFISHPHGPQYVRTPSADDTICVEYNGYILEPLNGSVVIWKRRKRPVEVIPNHSGPGNFVQITEIFFVEKIDGSIAEAKHFVHTYFPE